VAGEPEERREKRFSRRRLLGAAGIASAGAVVGGALGATRGPGSSSDDSGASAVLASAALSFYGVHQAGIATPAQDRMVFAAFDVTASNAGELREMLDRWTVASAAMAAGRQVADTEAEPLAPPEDTGEAVGLPAAQLTVTVGFGPSLFDSRFGLSSRRPAKLVELPHFAGDQLDPQRSGGDICIQACANDPQVAFHAVRNLARLGRGTAALRWLQLGFGRTSSTSTSQGTPRNLFGFKDGTNNIKAEDTAAMRDFVWVGTDSDQAWMAGGSYLVARRINMHIETWDRDSLRDQEDVFGRVKLTGAPLGMGHEFDTVDLAAGNPDGTMVVPANAHIRLAAAASNGGARILRRGYSFTDGISEVTGDLEAGLFFICYQNDPERQFIALQKQLAANDALNEYIVHTGSGIFACPGGIAEGRSWSSPLFD